MGGIRIASIQRPSLPSPVSLTELGLQISHLFLVSTDLDGARHEMDRIVQFMREKGFGVRHESGPDMRNGTGVDIVIVGSEVASREDAYYLIRHISLGFLGLALWWDVLWYGTDGTVHFW